MSDLIERLKLVDTDSVPEWVVDQCEDAIVEIERLEAKVTELETLREQDFRLLRILS